MPQVRTHDVAKPSARETSPAAKTTELTAAELAKIDAYWRASNYLAVGQIYLYDNPLLKEPLSLAQEYPKWIAPWNELRRKHDLVSPELEAFVGLSFQYADYSMRYGQTQPGPPSIVSTVKINQAGFTEMMDTEAMFRKWFGHARVSRLLP